jgi:hypothetical protein
MPVARVIETGWLLNIEVVLVITILETWVTTGLGEITS